MAITQVNEQHERSGSIRRNFERTYRRTWEVHTDDPEDGALAVMRAVGVDVSIAYSTGTESDAWAGATQISCDCTAEDGMTWKVTTDYGPWDPRDAENPLDAPYEIDWSFAQFESIADVDVNGFAVVNSAGDPFDPPVVRDDSRPVLTVTRNERLDAFDAAVAYSYRDTINADDFMGAGPHQVKVATISARRAYHPACGLYWVVTYVFHFNEDGWDKVILDQGLRYVSNATLRNASINGQSATAPVLLDGAGGILSPGAPAAYLTFQVYKESTFADFNIG